MILGCHILVIFTVLQKNRLLVKIGHFEAFLANFENFDLALGHSRVAPKGFFLLYYPYPVPKLLAETFLGLGPDLVHLTNLALAQNSRWSAPAFQMVAKKLFVHSKLVARLIVYSRWGK